MRMRAAAAVAATKGAVAASTKLVMFATQAAPGRLFLASPPRLKVRHWSARLGLVACWLWHRGALSPVRRLCLILLWCLWASACWGQDHIVSRSVLEDRNADLTLAQVSRQAMVALVNTGTIQGWSNGIYNPGTLGTLTNTGIIGSQYNRSLYNTGQVTTLNNAQGGATPLRVYGNLPIQYNLIINNQSSGGYGVLLYGGGGTDTMTSNRAGSRGRVAAWRARSL